MSGKTKGTNGRGVSCDAGTSCFPGKTNVERQINLPYTMSCNGEGGLLRGRHQLFIAAAEVEEAADAVTIFVRGTDEHRHRCLMPIRACEYCNPFDHRIESTALKLMLT